ncbi:S8 family serine peptidase [Micromonospora sp. RTP1Z1]|uniref:S8 family serine peptidase n=1 Tax=Micromonospora sp. RTP1Z1 TaxID=2994043 RepID=UPI0029C8C489|nr:S8 family serine peptidase [Micromonospora sp. RTP1Z1]
MKRRGVIRRSAVAGFALASATSIVFAGTGSAAMAAPSDAPRAPVRGADSAGVVPDRYIVVLKDHKASPSEVRVTASALAAANGGTVRHVFTKALKGYSAAMNRRQAERLAADPDVAYVEQVRRYSATDIQSDPPSWGLDRIDQTTAKADRSYTYPTTGAGVTAYILDTGIDMNHQEFGGRASSGFDFVDNDPDAQDCEGHGTHVAGTVGGTNYGVAKGVKLVAVRVLDCAGSGTSEQLVLGIEWVTTNALKPAVANMSLGFNGTDQAVNDAVTRSIASGVSYAVAAGNSMQDACGASPANVPTAITVGATDKVDFRAWFSNYGKCLDTFAPGVSIVSAAMGTTNGSTAMSGTSMASPHVAGAAALLLEANPNWTPQQVRDSIVTSGIDGAVHDTMGSVDRLLHVGAAQAARSSYGLKARINGKFVTAESAGTKPLIARGSALGAWEKYDVVDAGSGLVGLRAKVNGKYVTAESAGAKPLIARSAAIGIWEKFQIINNTDGTVSLKANINGRYVSADGKGTLPLIARATAIGAWEKFDFDAPAPVVGIKSQASGKYVTAESRGTLPLVPRAATPGAWEKFEIVNVGDGFFGLRALINGRFVTAESAGTKPLIARGTSIGTWEKFDFLDYNPDGSIYLRSYINGKAVTAGSAGTSRLIASRTVDWNSETLGLGVGEKFVFEAL